MNNLDDARRIKTIVVGNSSVGKSSLVCKAVYDDFAIERTPTIGAMNSTLKIDTGKGSMMFNIWDTAGQERYRSLSSMYYAGSGLALLVFDITSAQSFVEIRDYFVPALREKAPEHIKFVLVGNKADLERNRHVSTASAEELSEEIGALFYIETSAKTGQRVTELFERVSQFKGFLQEPQVQPFRPGMTKSRSKEDVNRHVCCA